MAETAVIKQLNELANRAKAEMAADEQLLQEHKANVSGLVLLCKEIERARHIKKAIERRYRETHEISNWTPPQVLTPARSKKWRRWFGLTS